MINGTGSPCDGVPGSCPCPAHSRGCPVLDYDLECPIVDWFCTEPEFGTDGEPCPPTCPQTCPPGMQTCPGEKDSNGCKVTEDTCALGTYFVRFLASKNYLGSFKNSSPSYQGC